MVLGISLIPKNGSHTQKIPPKTSVSERSVRSAAGKYFAFDEYKRDTQSDIARLESDLKSETSRRKSDDRKINKTITKENKQLKKQIKQNDGKILKINNALDPMKESVSDLEKKVDRIKEKSLMTDDEYKRFKDNQNK